MRSRGSARRQRIVYDLFHVVAKCGREVVDRVRVEEFQNATGRERELIKGSKYLRLSNKSNLSRAKRFRLAELLVANEPLTIVYVLKDQLKEIWKYRNEARAFKALVAWCELAWDSGIRQLHKFAASLLKHAVGILNHCRFPISTARQEGVNNKVKVIKRVAYGYGDDEYFALKIMGAFPGNSLQPNPR